MQDPTVRRRKRRSSNLLPLLGAGGAFAVATALVMWAAQTPAPLPVPSKNANPAEPSAPPISQQQAASGAIKEETESEKLISDDGRSLWAPPQQNAPMDLRWAPPGCPLMVSMRPAAMLSADPWRRVIEALGPDFNKQLRGLEGALGRPLDQIDRLTLAFRPLGSGGLDTTMVVRADNLPVSSNNVLRPEGDDGVAIFAAPETLAEVRDLAGEPPPMRRELEQLAASQVPSGGLTILCAPNFLYADGRDLLSGAAAPLREGVYLETPDEVRGVLLSVDLGEQTYLELQAIGAAEASAPKLRGVLMERMAGWPAALQLAVLDLNPAPYGRRLVAQLPAMLQGLVSRTRSGVVQGRAVLNCRLPLQAAPSIAMAAELLMAQIAGGPPGASSGTAEPPTPRDLSLAEKLRKPVTVVFARETLETGMATLAGEMQAEITILGGDLQLEGITKNQSFAMDSTQRPASEVLIEMLRKANPDTTATGPADPKQKLVFVVRPAIATGPETIEVTTRAAAAKRGEALPSAFQQ